MRCDESLRKSEANEVCDHSLPSSPPSLDESSLRMDEQGCDGSFVKEMSAMSLYNQILAYIEGGNGGKDASEPLVKSDESSPPSSPHDQSPEPLPNDGGDDSPHEDGGEDVNKNDESHASESLPKDDEDIDPNHATAMMSENVQITGGKLLSETVDNLTGGGMGKKESVKTPPPVKKDVDPNLFEGGAVLVTEFASAHSTEVDRSEARTMDENVSENGVRGRYTEFLHRLRTPKLFSGGSMNASAHTDGDDSSHVSECDLSHEQSESFVSHDGGNIDVLPVFPYLIRY